MGRVLCDGWYVVRVLCDGWYVVRVLCEGRYVVKFYMMGGMWEEFMCWVICAEFLCNGGMW